MSPPARGQRHFYGYTIVAASFLMQGACVGAMMSYGVFFKHLQGDFGWSRAFISGASSTVFFVMGALGILFGRLNDRLGPRRILLLSGVCLSTGYLLMSRLASPWQLYVFYGLLVGAGMSTHDVVTLSTVARWFKRRRGLMTGIVKAGTGTGQFVIPLVASGLIASAGWRATYVVIGVVVLLVYLGASRLMRRSPAEIGLRPYGDDAPDTQSRDSVGLPLSEAIRTPQFWWSCLSYFCVIFCAMTILVHIVPHASDMGMSEPGAAAVASTIGAVSVAGRMTMGTLSDRIGSRRSFLVCFAILILALLWLQIASSAWMLLGFAVVYGFAHGGFYTVLSPTVAELFGLRAHGAIFGIVYFWGTMGGAVGPVVAGRIFDMQQSYYADFWLLVGIALVGLLLMLRVRPAVEKRT